MFSRLRKLRDETADEQNVRRYVVFRNNQLAEMASKRIESKEAMEAIPGVGKGRLEKYGERLARKTREYEREYFRGSLSGVGLQERVTALYAFRNEGGSL